MKKIQTLLIISLFISLSAFSQKINTRIVKCLESNNPKKAVNILDSLFSAHPSQSPKMCLLKSISYVELYKVNNNFSLLDTAFRNLKLAQVLDDKKELNDELYEALIDLSSKYVYRGVEDFNNKKYDYALKAFESSIEIDKMPNIMQIDTIVIYNAALASSKLKKYDKAIDYYSTLVNYNFGDLSLILELAQTYLLSGNIDKYFETLKTAENKYGQTREIIEEYINFYLTRGDEENILKYSNIAIQKYPDNSKYYFIKGYALEQKGDDFKAAHEYSISLQLDSANINSLYNLAAIYYNKGVSIRKTAKTKEELAKSDENLTKSMKLCEKYLSISADDKQTLELLRGIYKILNFTDKFNEINDKLNRL